MGTKISNQLIIAIVSMMCFSTVSCAGCIGCVVFFRSNRPAVAKKEPKQSRKEKCELAAVKTFERDLKNAIQTKTTAKFDLIADYKTLDGIESVYVFGEVTAENTFGATVTERATAYYLILGDNLTLTAYTLNGKEKVLSQSLYEQARKIYEDGK